MGSNKKKKFYAVRRGLVPGIYDTWEECKANVDGFLGAQHRSYFTLEEAERYMNGENVLNERMKKREARKKQSPGEIITNKSKPAKKLSVYAVSDYCFKHGGDCPEDCPFYRKLFSGTYRCAFAGPPKDWTFTAFCLDEMEMAMELLHKYSNATHIEKQEDEDEVKVYAGEECVGTEKMYFRTVAPLVRVPIKDILGE